MKDERHVRQCRTADARWKPAAIVLAAVLLIISLPLAGRTVYAIDLLRSCSLSIAPGSPEMLEDLAQADLVIDVYRVADAVEYPGFDTYALINTDPFKSIEIPNGPDTSKEQWQAAAQQMAQLVLGTAEGKTAAWVPDETVSGGYKATGSLSGGEGGARITIPSLNPGMYLIIAHSKNIAAYAAPGTEANSLVTIANSTQYQYTFAPELVSLPAKTNDSTQPSNTADVTDWIYDAAVTLKPSRAFRAGRLEIEKELLSYAEREKTTDGETRLIQDPATFIFDVSIYENEAAYRERGEEARIYHDVVSIVFDAFGTKTVLIDDLQVDGFAVVEEVYSGGIYTTDTTKTATIEANETVTASFTNDYDKKLNGGGSVTNRFSYGETNGWALNQVSDDTQSSLDNPIQSFSNK